MEVTNIVVYPLKNPGKVIQANGTVTLNNVLDLKFTVMKGVNGFFVGWKGTEQYDKKDGSGKGYASPIYFKNDEGSTKSKLGDQVKADIINKFNNFAPSAQGPADAATPVVDTSFTSDDIPF